MALVDTILFISALQDLGFCGEKPGFLCQRCQALSTDLADLAIGCGVDLIEQDPAAFFRLLLTTSSYEAPSISAPLFQKNA